ncbi:hypothetical protein [Haloglomus litoreum]|uniref:hypothetical protein n=1 Tax=Haloglomus litoreum TaxID=3034026 RepID=UPI0023E7DE87|nr:hypothetical protein [Haloglomus sp. DT116]
MSPKRRDVLRAGGVAALLSGGLAGCIEDATDAPGEERPPYADWLFDTGTLFEASFRGFYSVDVTAYREQQAALPAPFNETVERVAREYDGVAVDDFDRVTGLGAFADPDPDDHGDEQYVMTSVGAGSFDVGAVSDAVASETSLEAAGSLEGYDLYTERNRYRPGETQAAAVADDAVILALANAGGGYRDSPAGETPPEPSGTPAGGVSAERAAELHAEAGADGSGGLLAANDRLGRLADALDGPIVGGLAFDASTLRERLGFHRPDARTATPAADGRDGNDDGGATSETPPPTPTVSDSGPSPVERHLRRVTLGLTAFGGSADASGASSGEVVFRLLYEDESAASDGADAVRGLRDALRAETEAFTVPEVGVTADGAAVAVTVTGDPSAFYEELGFGGREEPRPRAPQVSFTFDRREDGRVTVTHDGGDEVGTEGTIGLLYESEDEGIERRWQPDDGSVTAGDSITTDRPVTGMLRVIWTSANGGSSATLGLYRPPEGDEVPRVAFAFEIDAENRVTVTHEGGDAIDRSLVVVYDALGGSGKELWEPDDGAITAGDSFTTENGLAEDGSVRVLWDGPDPTVLAEYHTGATPTPRRTRTASADDTPTRTPRERTDTATPRETTETRTATPRESTETRTATPREATETRTTTPQRTRTTTAEDRGTPTRTATDTGTGTATDTPTATESATPTPVEDGTPTTN